MFSFWWHWVLVAAHGLSYPVACGILVARLGIKPKSSALEVQTLNTGLPGKPQKMFIDKKDDDGTISLNT